MSTLSEDLSTLTTTLSLVLGVTSILLGTIGGFLNIIAFSRPNLRKTSCGIYFLVASIASIALVLTGQISRLATLSSTSKLLTTFWFCKLRIYLTNVFGLLARGLIVLASFDRFLFCSLNVHTRAWCHSKIAIRIVIILTIISLILPVHILIYYELRLSSRSCRSDVSWVGTYDLSYQYIFVVILPSYFMFLFSFLLIRNLHNQRTRLARKFQTRDKQLIFILLSQIVFYTIIHIPLPINMTYNRLTLNLEKSRDRIAIENFLSFLINSELIYIYFSTTFFLHTIVSPTFRKEFVQIWRKSNSIIPNVVTAAKARQRVQITTIC
ncbi:unnamed protein product [Adineta ricciae]|uniref:G-protein coupled receptors family 1 profile domain-containing protein n=1 Tax=Adineta ricciae TaxID=249248 RepID=A0A815GFP2_ADIRI|nr:unnamed protein product [Adineta ricciae]CAF1454035.1 unnamed protein product [Adineta ricciae]